MSIQYKNSQRFIVTEQQAKTLSKYFIAYYEDDVLVKEESFYEDELIGLLFYNNDNENHLTIVNNNSATTYKWINIIEYEMFSGFKLERQYNYHMDGVLSGINLALYDSNNKLIAHGYKDKDGNYEYDLTRKYYWDIDINPERELFECTYHENDDLIWELYWNNFHIDENGQESFVLLNTASDILTLKNLIGISQELAEYYMSPEIIPTW